ncbi:hypothetical protein E2C01_031497 [Portunus trituberculatus]|uniref:Uncharacterized protein n=1 Tax=Portunus trituberculatus TaxID=210409 RepID=A0A5B7ESY0_PORTR|nr:hypothetical protein [Portunus trituberculatus]
MEQAHVFGPGGDMFFKMFSLLGRPNSSTMWKPKSTCLEVGWGQERENTEQMHVVGKRGAPALHSPTLGSHNLPHRLGGSSLSSQAAPHHTANLLKGLSHLPHTPKRTMLLPLSHHSLPSVLIRKGVHVARGQHCSACVVSLTCVLLTGCQCYDACPLYDNSNV